eukprot:m.56038 g.56038  ORF g.56038 m.56038 type:complete len:104 (+) comp13679_c0_seq1:2108-2419(+)
MLGCCCYIELSFIPPLGKPTCHVLCCESMVSRYVLVTVLMDLIEWVVAACDTATTIAQLPCQACHSSAGDAFKHAKHMIATPPTYHRGLCVGDASLGCDDVPF